MSLKQHPSDYQPPPKAIILTDLQQIANELRAIQTALGDSYPAWKAKRRLTTILIQLTHTIQQTNNTLRAK